jgi:tetratricopeptide (TPR) repeat protein
MVGRIGMTLSACVWNISGARCWRVLAAALLFALWMPAVFAQEEKGCEGVGFAGPPFSQYSPESLGKQLERNPNDVNALIHLALYLEEQDQLRQAEGLYERAIQAKPNCYLGYLFAGLLRDRISERTSSLAEANIRKALSFKPSLWNDPNVHNFRMSHPDLMGKPLPSQKELASIPEELLSGSDRFTIGLGVGLLLAAPFVYLARRRKSESGR